MSLTDILQYEDLDFHISFHKQAKSTLNNDKSYYSLEFCDNQDKLDEISFLVHEQLQIL
jgi:hypothetical protein